MIKPGKFHGNVVPLATPFTPEGKLDVAAAERIISRLLDNQIGIFVLGTTGEAASIHGSLRTQLVDIAVQTTSGRVPVFAGVGDNCAADAIAAANSYLQQGVDAVVAHLPGYYQLEAAEMQAYFELLADSIRGPLLLYNIPQTTGMSVPVEVVDRVSGRGNVIGFKDSENAPGRAEAVAARLAGRPDFSLFMGVARHSVKALRLGFDGLVPSSGNLAPEQWRDLYAAARAGDWERAETLQAQLDDIARVFQRDRSLAQSLAALKVAMESRGLCGPTVLPPLRPLDDAARTTIRRELQALGLN